MAKRIVLLLFLSGALGCASDGNLVSSALAARHYHDGRYRRECKPSGPPTCEDFRVLVNETLDEVTLCDETQEIGKLPPAARKRLKALKRRLERQP